MKNKNRSLFSLPIILPALLIVAGLSGCSLPYLHSDETELATQAAKDAADSIDAVKHFAEVKDHLLAFAVREDKAVADYLIAARDSQFTALLRGTPFDNKTTTIGLLQWYINDRFMQIIGTEKPEDATLLKLKTFPKYFSKNRTIREDNQEEYNDNLEFFNATKNAGDMRPTDCEKTPESTNRLPEETTADKVYINIVINCIKIANAKNSFFKEVSIKNDSAIATVFQQTENAIKNIASQKILAAEIKKRIEEIEALSKQNDSTLTQLTEKIEKVRELLEKAKGPAKFIGAKQLSEALEDILKADLNSENTDNSQTTQNVGAILKLSNAFAGIQDSYRDKPQINRVNSVLIALTEQRQNQDIALLDISRQQDLLAIYDAKQSALIQELAFLSRAQRLLNSVRKRFSSKAKGGFAVVSAGDNKLGSDVGSMLAAYTASWNQGQIPYTMLRYKEIQIERAYHVEVSAKTAQNRKDLLTPALDQLVAYGKGGIHPETIAKLITNLGLIAAFASN